MKKLIKRSVLMASLAAAGMGAQAEGISFYALLDGGVAHTAIKGAGTTASKTEFVSNVNSSCTNKPGKNVFCG